MLYLPEADLAPGVTEPSSHATHCPFKGDASYVVSASSSPPATTRTRRADPRPEAAAVRDHVSFLGEGIKIEVDRAVGVAAAA